MIPYNDGSTLHSANLERPRTDVRTSGTIGAFNGELVLNLNGESSASFDLRGTFSASFVVEGSDDGLNYISVPFYNSLTEVWQTIAGAAGAYDIPSISAFRVIRVRCSAYTSGSAVTVLNASLGNILMYAKPIPTTTTATLLTTANTGGTLTIAAPSIGMFHYITAIKIKRINGTAAAVAGTALLAITTTNLSALAFSSGNALAVGEDKTDEDLNFAGNPLKSAASNTATTFILPAGGAGVQYRIMVTYYVGA